MSTIDIRNAESIRQPMDVYCGMTGRLTNANGAPKTVTITKSGNVASDSNYSSTLQNTNIGMKTKRTNK